MLRDLVNNFDVLFGGAAAIADNTPLVTPIIDTRDYDAVMWGLITGTLADADATFTVSMEEGDDSGLSDAAAVADEDMILTEADASFQFDDDSETRKLGYIGNKRYVQLTVTPAGNSGAAPVAVFALGHKKRVSPA